MGGRFRVVVAFLAPWVVVAFLVGLAPVSASAAVTTPGGFTSLAPSRLLDTRSGVGEVKAAVAAGGTVHLQVTGRGGVSGVSGVSAVVLNVTVTAPARPGHVIVYGDGTARPTASNLNFVAAQAVPNLVIAPVGTNGKVALYNGSGGTIQLIADVSGYYLAGTPVVDGTFGSLAPSRLLDTRSGVGAVKAAVAAGGTVHLQVTGRGGVPASGVLAVVLNVTVTAPTKSGYLTAYGDGHTRPNTSNLNFVATQTVPNLVITPVGANGKIALYNGSTGKVHLIADVSGYYRVETTVRITYPQAQSLVQQIEVVRGISQGQPQVIWVVVYVPDVHRYFPQDNPAVTTTNDTWSSKTYFGVVGDGGRTFNVLATVADQSAQAAFRAYLAHPGSGMDARFYRSSQRLL